MVARYTLVDLDNGEHWSRVKGDFEKRELELGFIFRTVDKSRWLYIMGRDFIFNPAEYLRAFIQQHSLVASNRMGGFSTAGLWDRVSHLPFILSTTLFSAFLRGQLDKSGTGTVQLCHFTDTGLLPACSPSPFLRGCGELVRLLGNLQMAMGILLSEQFTNVFKPLVDALEGREQPLLYLPSNFLVFMIESTIYESFRIIRSIPGSATLQLSSPTLAASYIDAEIKLMMVHVLDKDQRAVDMCRHNYLVERAASEGTMSASASATTPSPLTPTPSASRSLICHAHARWVTDKSSEPCRFGETCRFIHDAAFILPTSAAPPALQNAAALLAKPGRSLRPRRPKLGA